MPNARLATIINFCTLDYPFLPHLLKEAKKFSSSIYVVLADHLFNGRKEDIQDIWSIAAEFSDVSFILFPYLHKPIFWRGLSLETTAHMWHNVNRLVGFHHLSDEIDYVFFLDADEIPEGDNLRTLLSYYPYEKYDCIKFACYWYFRKPIFQATVYETSPLMAKKSVLTRKLIMQKYERTGMFVYAKGEKIEGVLGENVKPVLHHYSWVRTKEEMLEKVRSWGHKHNKDWESLIHEEFSSEFQGKDFVHGYSFNLVESFIPLDLQAKPSKKIQNAPQNLKTLSETELFNILGVSLLSKLFTRHR